MSANRTSLRSSLECEAPPTWILIALGLAGAVVTGAAAGYRPAAGAAVILAIAAGLFLVQRPVFSAVLLAGVIPVIAGLKRGLLVPGLRLSEIAIIGVGILVLAPLRRERAAPWGMFDWLALTYALATALLGAYDTLHRGATLNQTDFGTLLGPLQYLVMYRVITTVLRTPERYRRALRLLILLSPAVSLSAIAQQLNVPGIRSALATVTGTVLYGANPEVAGERLTIPPRASGLFPFWHETGGYLMIIVLLSAGLMLSPGQRLIGRRVIGAVLVIDAAALVETVTIAPILGALVGTLVLGVWYGRGTRVLACIGVGAALLGGLFYPLLRVRATSQFATTPGASVTRSPLVPQTIAYRLLIFQQQDVPLLRGRWLTGYGPSLPSNYAFGFTESLYFTLLLRGGVILLAVYLALMWAFALRAVDVARHAEPAEQVLVARVALIALALLVLIHFIEGYFVDTGPADLIWVLAGLVGASNLQLQQADGSRPRARSAVPPSPVEIVGGAT